MARKYQLRERGVDYLLILLGTFLMAVSANFFYTPANMVPGGFTGLAIIFQHLTRTLVPGGLPVWFWNILLNVPLILFSIRVRGWRFVRRTLVASLVFSAWMFVLPEFSVVDNNLFLVAVIGGGLMGGGIGLVFMGKATTGGTDTVAALLQRALPHLNTARIMPVLDAVTVLLSVWIFGMEVSLYAIITVILCGRIADGMVTGARNACMAYIISKYTDDIAAAIGEQIDRGATVLHGTGTYTNRPREVLMVAVSNRQTALLRDIVSEIDPRAFFILTDASEVRGEGFLSYNREEL